MPTNDLTQPNILIKTLQNPYFRETLKLSLPLILSNLISILTTFIGVVMLGKLGHTVLAASALITTTQTTFQVISMGILFSIGALVGRAHGAKQYHDIGTIMQQGCLLALIIAIPLTLLFWNIGHLLTLFGEKLELVAIVQTYFHAFIWSVPATLLLGCAIQFMTGLAKRLVIFTASLTSLAILTLFAWVLIFGHGGLPKLGVAGLGYATAIQSWLILLGFIIYLKISPEYQPYQLFKLRLKNNFSHLKHIFQIGWPICLQMAAELLSFFVVTIMIGWLNPIALAARQITIQLLFFMIIPSFAIAQAATVLVSRAIGRNQPQDVKAYGNYALGIGMAVSITLWLICYLFATPLISIFVNTHNPQNADLISLAIILLTITTTAQIFDSIRNISSGSLRGLYDTKYSMIISLLSLWLISVPLGYLVAFPLNGGVIGYSLVYNITISLAGLVLFLRWRQKSNTHTAPV